MSHEVTFDMDNQPGIRKATLGRADYKRLAETLGLDPNYVMNIEAGQGKVIVTAILQTTDGAKALGGGGSGGFLKHTYEIPVEGELCTPGNIYGSNPKGEA